MQLFRLTLRKSLFNFGSIKQFKLPDLGEKIKEATVKEWHVKVGDKVEEFQPVADVSTDKMFTQIPSSYKGVVHKIFHKVDDQCQVGELFLEIEVENETSQSEVEVKQTTADKIQEQIIKKQTETQETQQQSKRTLAGPVVRRIAREKGINLSEVVGTGNPPGRVLAIDIENHILKKQQKTFEPQIKPQVQVQIQQTIPQSQEEFVSVKMNDFQKGMYKSMTESNTIPHAYMKDEIDITELSNLRETLKKQLRIPITFTSLFMKAFSMAMLKYPMINSHYDPNKPFEYKTFYSHNISFALDTPKGLVVPNVKNCQNLSIVNLQNELNRLKTLGEKGQLTSKELLDGTICLSNIGTIGGTYTGPLILPPQICIVGIGRSMILPRYNEKMELVPKKIINVSLAIDHRVLDGATITRFANLWRSYIETPYLMLTELK